MSNVWKIFQEKLENNQTHTKKAQIFLWFPVEDINISDIFYQIQKFLGASWASIITTNGINFLMAGPFKKKKNKGKIVKTGSQISGEIWMLNTNICLIKLKEHTIRKKYLS